VEQQRRRPGGHQDDGEIAEKVFGCAHSDAR